MSDNMPKMPVKATITFGEVWQAFRDEGLLCDSPVMDSVLHRCATDDRQSSKNGWYVYHSLDNGRAAVLVLADWRHGGYTKYRVTDDTGMTSRDWRKKYSQQEKAAEEAAKKAKAEQYAKARQKAQSIWDSGKPCPKSFPYMVRKQFFLPTLRLSASGQMIVPVFDAMGEIQSLQFIAPEKVNGKDKTFLTGGKMQGGHFSMSASADKESSNVLLIGEGLATVCSACLATGYAGEVCFNCGNLKQVATDLYTKFPDKKFVMLEDNDRHNELTVGNAGVEHAYEAAVMIDACIAHVPADEGQNRDFNDLYCQEGADAVRVAIETAVQAENASATWEPNRQWLKVKRQGKATATALAPAQPQADDMSGQDVAPAPAPATPQAVAEEVGSAQEPAPSAGVAQDVAGQEPAQSAQPQTDDTAQPAGTVQAVETAQVSIQPAQELAPNTGQEPIETYSPTGKGNVVFQPQEPVQVAMDTALPTAQDTVQSATAQDVAQPQEPAQTASAQAPVQVPAQPQAAGVADDTGEPAQADDVPFPDLDEVPDCDIASVPWTKKEKDWLKEKVQHVLADVCRNIARHKQDSAPDRIDLIKKAACRVLPLARYAETGTAGKTVASDKIQKQLVQAGVDTGLTADRIEAVIEQLDVSGKLETSFDYVAEHRQQREESWLYADVTAKQWDEKSTDEKLEFVARKRKLKNGDYVPRGFFLHPVYGIQKADGKTGYFESIANRPISVLAKGCDTASGNWGYTLSWQDDNRKEHKFFVENSRLTGGVPQKNACTAELGGGDYCVDSAFTGAFAKFVTNYQTAHRCHVTFTGGWLETDGRHAFVMPSRSITQDGMTPVYLLPQDGNDPFVSAGTLEEWRNTIGTWSVGNSRMVTALCLAFSGHILPLLNAESIGIHFWGDSSKGKSTLTYVASSVMGKSSDCIQTWDTTKNAPEILATKHNNSLLCLDEVNMADKGVLEKALYKLGNGKGKSRATRTGGLQAQRSWQVCILSTGEHSNEQKISHEKEDVMAGQLVRILDIQAVASAGNGVFDVVPAQFEGARQFAEKIKEVSETFYGTPRDAFCQYIADNWDTAKQELVQFRDTAIAKMQERYSQKELAGQTGRVLAKLAVLAAAGELAAKLNIVPWAAGYATQIIADKDGMFDQWVLERGGTGQKEEKQTCNFFSQYIQLHPRDFETLSDGTVPTEKPLKRMGFREVDEYGRAVYIFPTDLFKQMCQEGGLKDPKTCARHLAENGYLLKAQNGSFSGWRKSLPDLGQKRCRVLQLPDDEEPQTQPADTATATQREFLKELVGTGSTGMSGAPADTSAVAGAPATAETVSTPAQPQVTAQPAVSMQSAPAPVAPQEPQPAAQLVQEPAQPATAQPQAGGRLSGGTPAQTTDLLEQAKKEASDQWFGFTDQLQYLRLGEKPCGLNRHTKKVIAEMGGYAVFLAMQREELKQKKEEFIERYSSAQLDSVPPVPDVPAYLDEVPPLNEDELFEAAADGWAD